jgi:hypothetical protein
VIKEFLHLPKEHPDAQTDFNVGDLVSCTIDPLYLTESAFDCGRHLNSIGIVVNISFYQRLSEVGLFHDVICELEIFWFATTSVSYHLDKYVLKLQKETT